MVLRNGSLIAKRGITLSLTVTESIGAEELLEKAVVKGFTYSQESGIRNPESGIQNLEREILKISSYKF